MAEAVDYVGIAQQEIKIPRSIRTIRFLTKLLSMVSPNLAAKFLMPIFSKPGRFKNSYRIEGAGSSFIRFNGKKIHLLTKGQGEKVLVVHGWGASIYQMRHIINTLAENGFQAISFDGPAHGLSEGRYTDGREIAELILKLCKEMDICNVISHSFGGFATIVAISRGLKLKKFIAISLPVNDDPLFGIFFRTFQVPPKTQQELRKRFEQRIGVKIEEYLPINMEITLPPTTIIHDRDDPITKFEHMMQFARKHTECNVVETKGLGHRRILKDLHVLRQIPGVLL
ncbi:MAG: alpha/beta hydrolase [Methanobacteriota archaeon]|nr:MAG: alpha/beta hydrolase [Euryarchaeota archaeon]